MRFTGVDIVPVFISLLTRHIRKVHYFLTLPFGNCVSLLCYILRSPAYNRTGILENRRVGRTIQIDEETAITFDYEINAVHLRNGDATRASEA